MSLFAEWYVGMASGAVQAEMGGYQPIFGSIFFQQGGQMVPLLYNLIV